MSDERERAWDETGRWCGTGEEVPHPETAPSEIIHEGCDVRECGGEFQCSKCNRLVGWCFGHSDCTRCNDCCVNRRCPGVKHTASFSKQSRVIRSFGENHVVDDGWLVICSCNGFSFSAKTREHARERHRMHKDLVGE